MRRVKIEGGLIGEETHVYDAETGKEIEHVVDVRISLSANGKNEATVITHSFEKVEVEHLEIEAEAEIDSEQETIVPDVKVFDGQMRFSFAGWSFTTPGGDIHDLFMIKLGNLVDAIEKKNKKHPSGQQLKLIAQEVQKELGVRLNIESVESAHAHIFKIQRRD